MSDFVNSGWAWYVAGLVVASLAFCVFILVVASKRKVMAADNTTGHVWDEDLREMNNPLPRWWMYLFVITVVFAAIYLALYPGPGHQPRGAEVEQRRPVGGRAAEGLCHDGAGLCQVHRHAGRGAGQGQPGHGHR